MLPPDDQLRAVQEVAIGEVRRQMESRGTQRGYLLPEHLALGLFADPGIEGLFDNHGVTNELRRVIGVGLAAPWEESDKSFATAWEVRHTLRATVLESIAAAEAKRLGHATVSPWHLALALVLYEDTLVAHMLIDVRADKALQDDILARLATRPRDASPEGAAVRLNQVRDAVLLANGNS